MITIKGILEFTSLWNPINLETEDGEIDLRVQIFELFENLNGKKTSMTYGMNDLKIATDDSSKYVMKFHRDTVVGDMETILMILDVPNEFGFSNIGAYLPDTLQRLNGMRIIVETDETSISFRHDEDETVNEIKYTSNNSCHVSDDDVKTICKIGQEDCCIFLTASGDGFNCEKFNSGTARILLDRHAEGTMNATRIGNCKIVGRIDNG